MTEKAGLWTLRELAAAGEVEYSDGYRTMKAELGTTGFPILRVAEIQDGKISPNFAEFVRPEFRPSIKEKISRPGDVVLTTKGTVGRVALMPPESEGFAYSPQVCFFRIRDEHVLTPRYLYYWLRSDEFRHQAAAMKGQTDMADYLNLADIGALKISLPALWEQRAIVEVLGALDDKIAVNEHIAATSLALSDSLYQQLQQTTECTDPTALGKLASKGLLEFGDGYRTKRSEHGKPGLPILRVAEVGDGGIQPMFGDYVRNELRPAMGRKISRAGDVVLTTKGTVGRTALISTAHPEFVYSPQVCYFRIAEECPVSTFYLFHWLRSPEFWRQAKGMKGQTDMADYLSLSDVRSLRITLPKQAQLLNFDQDCAALRSRTEAARIENRTLAELRDTLLPQLVTGKIRIKDAERAVEDAV